MAKSKEQKKREARFRELRLQIVENFRRYDNYVNFYLHQYVGELSYLQATSEKALYLDSQIKTFILLQEFSDLFTEDNLFLNYPEKIGLDSLLESIKRKHSK